MPEWPALRPWSRRSAAIRPTPIAMRQPMRRSPAMIESRDQTQRRGSVSEWRDHLSRAPFWANSSPPAMRCHWHAEKRWRWMTDGHPMATRCACERAITLQTFNGAANLKVRGETTGWDDDSLSRLLSSLTSDLHATPWSPCCHNSPKQSLLRAIFEEDSVAYTYEECPRLATSNHQTVIV